MLWHVINYLHIFVIYVYLHIFGIARSMMEFVFISLEKSGEKVLWLCNFAEGILFWSKPLARIFLRCDSHAIIGKAWSVMYDKKSCNIQ